MKPMTMALLSLTVLIALGMAAVNPQIAPHNESATQPQSASAGISLPAATDITPRDYHGLHNVVAYHDGYSFR